MTVYCGISCAFYCRNVTKNILACSKLCSTYRKDTNKSERNWSSACIKRNEFFIIITVWRWSHRLTNFETISLLWGGCLRNSWYPFVRLSHTYERLAQSCFTADMSGERAVHHVEFWIIMAKRFIQVFCACFRNRFCPSRNCLYYWMAYISPWHHWITWIRYRKVLNEMRNHLITCFVSFMYPEKARTAFDLAFWLEAIFKTKL